MQYYWHSHKFLLKVLDIWVWPPPAHSLVQNRCFAVFPINFILYFKTNVRSSAFYTILLTLSPSARLHWGNSESYVLDIIRESDMLTLIWYFPISGASNVSDRICLSICIPYLSKEEWVITSSIFKLDWMFFYISPVISK